MWLEWFHSEEAQAATYELKAVKMKKASQWDAFSFGQPRRRQVIRIAGDDAGRRSASSPYCLSGQGGGGPTDPNFRAAVREEEHRRRFRYAGQGGEGLHSGVSATAWEEEYAVAKSTRVWEEELRADEWVISGRKRLRKRCCEPSHARCQCRPIRGR